MMKSFHVSLSKDAMKTEHDTISIRDYFADINRYPMLSSKEENNLLSRLCLYKEAKEKNADVDDQMDLPTEEDVKNTLITSNLRFVISVAKSYLGNGAELPDLIEDGNKGLIEAYDAFDPDYGVRFLSFAIFYIRRSIHQGLPVLSSQIVLPVNTYLNTWRVEKLNRNFVTENYREPSVEELSELGAIKYGLGKNNFNIPSLIGCKTGICGGGYEVGANNSLDYEEAISRIASKEYYDFLQEERLMDKDMDKEQLTADVHRLLSILNQKEFLIVYLVFGFEGIDYSFQDASAMIGVSSQRARVIYQGAIKKIRRNRFAMSLRKEYYEN